jgi:PAS domain S-box-containing protein
MQKSPGAEPDFRALFESAPGLYLVLTPDLRIVAVSDAYLRATMTGREEILGREIFDVFPDNPDDPTATGVQTTRASFERVVRNRHADGVAAQKFDIRRPEPDGGFEERYWSLVSWPVLGEDGNVAHIVNRVEDVTEFVRLKQSGLDRDKLTDDLRQRAEGMAAEILLHSGELEEANRRRHVLEAFIERAPVGLAMFDRRMRHVRASRRWLEDCGILEKEILGKSHYEVFPDLPEHWKEAHRRGLAGEPLQGEDDWVAPDGKRHSTRWEIQPWGDSGVETGGIIIFSEEITGRKAAAESLRESEARFRSMYEQAAVGILQVAIDGRFLMVNPALCRMLGYGESELLSRTFMDVTHPDDWGRDALLLEEMLHAGRDSYRIEKRYLHRDGSTVWVDVTSSLVRDGTGRPLYRISIIQDVTEREQAVEARRIGEERLAAIIGSAMDAIITLDDDQRIVLFNSAAEKIFGCAATAAIGKLIDGFIPERFCKTHHHHIQTFGSTGETTRSMQSPRTLYGRRANGEEFPLEATISQASLGGQKLYTVILRDITQRQRAEEVEKLYFQSRELDRLKTEFFANISHELRTPLALILGPVRKRLAAGGMTADERQDLELVERNARLVLRHVNDLLDLSKLDAGRMNAEYAGVDLVRMVRRVASNFDSLAKERGVACIIETPGSLAAEVDPPKIERVLLNLLSNAFKFTPAGGNVRIAVRGVGGRAILEVEDSGPGIPPDLREAIFERFRQLESGADRRFGGTGLGLPIARQLVSLHGGSIRVEEPRNRSGSLFQVELPLVAPGGTEVRRGAEEPDLEAIRQTLEELKIRDTTRWPSGPSPASSAPIVLLVEDNPDMNAFIAETLSATYRVFCAFDGQEGLEKALEVRPDLILCDIMMPRMSGDRLVTEIRRHRELEDVPIVLLTAKADEELRIKLLREGAQDYLHKPFDTRVLLAKVDRLIADRRRRKESEEALQRLSGSLLQVHDQERKRIAQELHENTVQCLAALQIRLSMARTPASSPGVQRILADGYALLEQCSAELRTLSYGLHPPLLDHLGLRAAMELHVQNFNKAGGIQVSLEIPHNLGRLPPEFELTLFRVMQESLMDLRCHSGPEKVRVTEAGVSKTGVTEAGVTKAEAGVTKATVRVFRDACEVGLEVIAEGWPAGEPAAEIGMAAMRERVRRLGGQLEIAAEAEATAVRAVLPLPQAAIPASLVR